MGLTFQWQWQKMCDKLILRSNRLISFHFTTFRMDFLCSGQRECCEPWKWLLQLSNVSQQNVPFNKMLSLILFVFVKAVITLDCFPVFSLSALVVVVLFRSLFFIFILYHFIKCIYEVERNPPLFVKCKSFWGLMRYVEWKKSVEKGARERR